MSTETITTPSSSSSGGGSSSSSGSSLDSLSTGSQHVDYEPGDALPFKKGRFLGRGVNGDVLETQFNGMVVAWKTILCRSEISSEARREMEVLRKLRHHHIIQLVGTYTHGRWLGLLLWPVARCDLATFLEDVELVRWDGVAASAGMDVSSVESKRALERLRPFGTGQTDGPADLLPVVVARLTQSFGCIMNAVEYLHKANVRHKDLKPANILLSPDGGIWIADFGKSTDFSDFTESGTNGGDRGTPKYFAPEVAAFEQNGRSADIFSLGCIFLEMLAVCIGTCTLQQLRDLRPMRDQSFHANIRERPKWFNQLKPADTVLAYLIEEVAKMLELEPERRPSAARLKNNLALVDTRWRTTETPQIHGKCCTEALPSQYRGEKISQMPSLSRSSSDPSLMVGMSITIGNTHALGFKNKFQKAEVHQWTLFVRPSPVDVVQLVEFVPFILHTNDPTPRTLLPEPPFEISRSGVNNYKVKISIVLKADYQWERDVPRQGDTNYVPSFDHSNRILTFDWLLDFSGLGSETTYAECVVCRAPR